MIIHLSLVTTIIDDVESQIDHFIWTSRSYKRGSTSLRGACIHDHIRSTFLATDQSLPSSLVL
jgi:hypothetical protein